MFFFLSLLLQCKFANSTLLPQLSFSYFITPYDAQASSAFSALIYFCKFSIKTYVAIPHLNRLDETVLMRGHNVCFMFYLGIIIRYLHYLELYHLANNVSSGDDLYQEMIYISSVLVFKS